MTGIAAIIEMIEIFLKRALIAIAWSACND